VGYKSSYEKTFALLIVVAVAGRVLLLVAPPRRPARLRATKGGRGPAGDPPSSPARGAGDVDVIVTDWAR